MRYKERAQSAYDTARFFFFVKWGALGLAAIGVVAHAKVVVLVGFVAFLVFHWLFRFFRRVHVFAARRSSLSNIKRGAVGGRGRTARDYDRMADWDKVSDD